MDNFIFKGKSSEEFDGIIVNSLPSISKPPKRVTKTEIEGRDGDIIEFLGYESYDKTITITLLEETNIDELINWLNGSGKLILSNEPDKYYEAEIIEQIDFDRLFKYEPIEIVFHCQPYKYLVDEEKKIIEMKSTEVSEEIVINDSCQANMKLEVGGNSVQETSEMGINYLDASKFDDSNAYITRLEDGWYHIERENTASTIAYVNVLVPIEYNFLKENTNYTVMAEIRNVNTDNLSGSFLRVTGDRSVFGPSMTVNGTQLLQGDNKYTAQRTTISDFSSYTYNYMLSTFVGIQVGETADFDFRISIYDANYTGDYVAFVPNMPSTLYPNKKRNCGDNINLLNIQDIEETTNAKGITYSVQDGTITLNGTSTGAHYIIFPTLNNFKKDTYTMSTKVLEGSYSGTAGKQINNVEGSAILFNGGYLNDTVTAVIANDTTGVKLALYIGGNAVFNNYKIKLKLEKGDKATGWSKHGCGCTDLKVQNKNYASTKILKAMNLSAITNVSENSFTIDLSKRSNISIK